MKPIKKLYWYLMNSYLMPHHLLTRLAYFFLYKRFIWHGVLNHAGVSAYKARPPKLSASQSRSAKDLKKEGVALLNFEELFPGRSFKECQEKAEQIISSPQHQEKIRAAANATGGHKFYLVRGWEKSTFDFKNPLMNLAISDELLSVAASYLGMYPRLLYLDLWYNCPTPGDDVYSQRWHRDADDKKILKMFLLLRDVDDGSGPFSYIPGTQDEGRYSKVFASAAPYNSYPPADGVAREFPKEKQFVGTGKAGTVLLADTSGIHKGGHAVKNARFLLNIAFRTDGSYEGDKAKNWNLNAVPEGLSPLAKFALSLP